MTHHVFVPGKAAAQGSKRHVGNGRMIEASKNVGPWRETVAVYAHKAHNTHIDGEVDVTLEFVMPRPKTAPKTKYLPATKRNGDIDKLARSVLDALTGVWFEDDAQVVHLDVFKTVAGVDEEPGVHITAREWKVAA